MEIPFGRPYISGNELRYLDDLISKIKNGRNISGDGEYTQKASRLLESRFGSKKALLTTSCTSALELATNLLNLGPGDEVIAPSFTFPSTVNPIVLVGARPVFAEIAQDTLNIDPDDIRKKLGPKTKAIYPVHYAGVACDMDEILEIANENNLKVVEDAAQGVNAGYKGKFLGTLGDFGCYSFHDSKNYVCGEGGCLMINTDDLEILDRAEILREKGTNRNKFNRGEVDKYTWVDIGSSYLLSDLLAAFLYAQLEKIDEIQSLRMRIYDAYYQALKPFQESGLLRLPTIPDYAQHNAHLFYILFKDMKTRDRIMKRLKSRGIWAVFHYVPLHSSPMGLKLGNRIGDLPVTESLSERLLRLPMYADMTDEELKYIIFTLKTILKEERQ